MSVFSDFQKAWAQRFPECELPQAWEEDVRANLSKHRHRVALLREDLEKEEFYVEYLERLLADVERVKRSVIKDYPSDGEMISSLSQNGGLEVGTSTSVGCNTSEITYSKPEKRKKLGKKASKDIFDIQDNYISSSDGIHKPISNNDSQMMSPLTDNDETYVTVIEVGGNSDVSLKNSCDKDSREPLSPSPSIESNTQLGQCDRSTGSDSPKEEVRTPQTPTSPQRKKRPPAPPPKRPRRPVQAVPPVKKVDDNEVSKDKGENNTFEKKINERDDLASSQNFDNSLVIGKAAKPTFNTFKPINTSQNVKTETTHELQHQESVNGALSSVSSTPEERLDRITQNHNKADYIEGTSRSVTSMDSNYSIDEQAIYDTVAPDEEIVPIPEQGNIVLEQENLVNELEELELEDEDIEGDYVVFSERPILPSNSIGSQESMHGLQLNTPEEKENKHVSRDQDRSSPDCATYMNIDFFLKNKKKGKFGISSQGESFGIDSDEEDAYLVRSFSSDQELDGDASSEQAIRKVQDISAPTTSDDVFEIDSGVYSSSVESTSFLCTSGSSTPSSSKKRDETCETTQNSSKEEAERMTMYKCILSSIIESETIYVECLNLLLQYMKALKSTIGTSQPLLSQEDFSNIFFKIPELHTVHQTFLQGLKKQADNWDGKQNIGDHFKILASKLGVYASFLQNYSKAIESVRKCSLGNTKFSEITKSIKLKSLQGQATTLEDLLHKPVARVQKNALVLHDLLRYTPEVHQDQKTLKTALKMTQCFLNDLNMSATENMFPATDRAQRHLVKNSFIVELSEGHRKLRHLFLFSDVIVCAKYKPSTRQKFTFEVKWCIPLSEVLIPDAEDPDGIKESSPYDVLGLKSRASNVRDQILKEEMINQGKEKVRAGGRNLDKLKKKIAELEAQLVLASPNLPFRVGQKNGKIYTFFLSSEFDRGQWTEAISILQASAPTSASPLSPYELQPWVMSCRKQLGTNLGSFLLRTGKDEDLLVGDLYIAVHKLHGLARPTDTYLCFEVDSYGHFFNKAKTKICHNSLEPNFNQDFVVELEGSQTLRILCYEEDPQNQAAVLRGKGALELSRSWLTDKLLEKSISLQELMLTLSLKFVPSELTLRRIPSTKPVGLFGVKVQQVCKKEKSSIPFVISSCIREVEKRGMSEIGVYRVSGSASDVQRLKKTFESNVYEAEQLLKEVDIHSVTGLFKLYLRELPEALFTDCLYPRFFQAFNSHDQEEKKNQLLILFDTLPVVNQEIIKYLLDHMIRVNDYESTNKMSLHNLATVFGPTVLRPGNSSSNSCPVDLLTASTVDVMAQAGIFYFFLRRHSAGLPLNSEPQECQSDKKM